MSTKQQQQPGWREILGYQRRPEAEGQLNIEDFTSGCYMIEKGATWTEWEACLLALLRSIPRCESETQYAALFIDYLRNELATLHGETHIFIEEGQPVNC